MAKTKNATAEKPMINKIAGKAAFIAGEVVGAKNAIVEMAGGAIASVKETIHNITAKKPAAKKAAKKAVKKVVKKAAPVKKVIKKAEKKVVKKAAAAKKAVKKVVKKAVTAKKAVKKVARKK